MSHPRKKHGERKDKKNERMREDVALRKAHAQEPNPTSDQPDVMNFKPGGPSDSNRHTSPSQR